MCFYIEEKRGVSSVSSPLVATSTNQITNTKLLVTIAVEFRGRNQELMQHLIYYEVCFCW